MHRLLMCLGILAGCAVSVHAQQPGEPDPQVAEDEQILKAAKIGTDAHALLDFLRQQTLKEDERQRMAELIKRLEDKSFQKRQKAVGDVIALGPKALPVLRQAMQGATLEMRMRIERCVKELEKDSPALTAGAVVRTLKLRRPPGACGVLLAYLTSAPDANVEEEVVDAIAGLGVVGGQVDPVLEPALADPAPGKRAAAALVLGRFGSRHQRALVHLLLDDPNPAVQLRAAQGLLLGRDRTAVPALIGLLAKAPLPIAEQAEDVLMELAGKSAPSVSVGDDGEARQKSYKAWREWWQTHQTKIDLARADLETLASKNPTLRAREIARQFVLAIFRYDKGLIRKTTDLPFVIGGFERIENREGWDQLLAQIPQQEKQKEVKLAIQRVISVDDYAKFAPKEELSFVESVRKQPIRIVVGDVFEDGKRMEQFALFVRMNGARARVIALGIPRQGLSEKELTK